VPNQVLLFFELFIIVSSLFVSFYVLHLIFLLSLLQYNAGKAAFTKKQADLFFPPDFADDFPVAMQVLNLPFFV